MPPLIIKNIAAPNLTGISQILANATNSLNTGLSNASSLLDKYNAGQQESADAAALDTIASISSEEELNQFLGSGQLQNLNLSPTMRDTVLNLRNNIISNNQSRAGVDQTRANTNLVNTNANIARQSERRRESTFQDSVNARNERRNLTPLTVAANVEGNQQGKNGFTLDAPRSLLTTESGNNFAATNDEVGSSNRRGHFGRVQFSRDRFDDAKRAGAIPRNMSIEEFGQDNPTSIQAQKSAENWHFKSIQNFIDQNGLNNYIGQNINGVNITRDGLVAIAHLGGSEGMKRYLETNGRYDPSDSNGTSLSDYAIRHAGNTTSRQNRPAFNALQSAITNSVNLDPVDAQKLIADAYSAQIAGQNRIDVENERNQSEISAGAILSSIQNPNNINIANVTSDLINNTAIGSGNDRISAITRAQALSAENGPLSSTLSPNPEDNQLLRNSSGIFNNDELLRNSVEIFNNNENNRIESSVQNRLINRANNFNEDPTNDLIEFLKIGSDGETPRSNWFFANHDPNTLRSIINDVAIRARVTPKIAASALAEIFNRDPVGNNSDANRFDIDDAVNFIQANLSQPAVNRFNERRVVSESKRRELSSLTLQLRQLESSALKYNGNNIPPALIQQIQNLQNKILQFTNDDN